MQNDFYPLASQMEPLQLSGVSDITMDTINTYSYVVLYYTDGIQIKETPLTMVSDHLLELRAFSEAGEYYCIRTENGFVGRIRTDESGTEKNTECYDTLHKVWGSSTAKNRRILREDRGTVVNLPFDINPEEFLFVRVRNYFSATEDLRFEDWRFVGFEKKKSSLLTEVGQYEPKEERN